tara:strand:- start:582 stop:806 length:225 start_codon:yes stop_codon:yes gene_type:complete
MIENEPLVVKLKPGDTVFIGEDEIAKVLTFIGRSRDLDAQTLFQAANVDTGEIYWVHVKEQRDIVSSCQQQQQQ